LTYSSGNHAQALALAGSLLGAPVVVVMPDDAPAVKRAATEGYGGEVILYDRDETTREVLGTRLAEERGLTLVPPYDHPHIIAGAGTAVRELILEAGELDLLLVCLGGGGLLSGSAVSAKALAPQCQVIGVEPEAGDDIARSFRSGQIETVKDPITIADGARTPSASALTFAHIQAHVDDVVTVTDATLVECTKFYAERMKLLIEPTGCLSLAAAWEGKVDVSGKKVGVVVSGGNVDLTRLASLWTGGTGLD
jgi:threonine dehydratase